MLFQDLYLIVYRFFWMTGRPVVVSSGPGSFPKGLVFRALGQWSPAPKIRTSSDQTLLSKSVHGHARR